MNGDIVANIVCENKQQKIRVGDIHNQENVTLICDQATKTWSLVAKSNKVYKSLNRKYFLMQIHLILEL